MEKGSNTGVVNKIRTIGVTLLGMRELTIFIILLLFSTFLSLATNKFLTVPNVRVIFIGLSYEMIVCAAMTVGLIGNQIDFSVGSTVGFCGFACCIMLRMGWNMWICIAIALGLGAILGAINGILVCKLNILPLVATMGTWMIYKGLGLAIIRNQSIANLPANFKAIGQRWSLFGLPFSIYLMVVVCLAAWFCLKYIRFFHQAFYIGENKESAKLAGINTNKFCIITYAVIGVSSAIGGIMLASRFGSAPSTLGTGLEFKLVTAMLIGGVSFSGGGGSILGAFVGALMLQVITNALALFNVESNLQSVVVGVILVFAVAIDEYNQRRRRGT
jgi:ribose transport system permease protein